MHKDFRNLHRAFLHPAPCTPEHKIPGVEKPVTSALVPILGGLQLTDWVWGPPRPARPAAEMLTIVWFLLWVGELHCIEGRNSRRQPTPAILHIALSQHPGRLKKSASNQPRFF